MSESHHQRVQCYLEIQHGKKKLGRIVIELWDELQRKTSENFRALCTGEKGVSPLGNILHYADTTFTRVKKKFLIQGGDVSRGKGGESIYGKRFSAESFRYKLDRPGLVAMANIGHGKRYNSSQFFITFSEALHLDGENAVFGEIVEGMDILYQLEQVAVRWDDAPVEDIFIVSSGQLEPKDYIVGAAKGPTLENPRKRERMDSKGRVIVGRGTLCKNSMCKIETPIIRPRNRHQVYRNRSKDNFREKIQGRGNSNGNYGKRTSGIRDLDKYKENHSNRYRGTSRDRHRSTSRDRHRSTSRDRYRSTSRDNSRSSSFDQNSSNSGADCSYNNSDGNSVDGDNNSVCGSASNSNSSSISDSDNGTSRNRSTAHRHHRRDEKYRNHGFSPGKKGYRKEQSFNKGEKHFMDTDNESKRHGRRYSDENRSRNIVDKNYNRSLNFNLNSNHTRNDRDCDASPNSKYKDYSFNEKDSRYISKGDHSKSPKRAKKEIKSNCDSSFSFQRQIISYKLDDLPSADIESAKVSQTVKKSP